MPQREGDAGFPRPRPGELEQPPSDGPGARMLWEASLSDLTRPLAPHRDFQGAGSARGELSFPLLLL